MSTPSTIGIKNDNGTITDYQKYYDDELGHDGMGSILFYTAVKYDIIKHYENEGLKIVAMKLMKMDERIASGSYFAKAFAKMQSYLKNPTLLETPPETIKVDYEFEGLSERFKSEKTKAKEAKKAAKAAKKNK